MSGGPHRLQAELIEYYTGYGFQSVRMNESGTLMMMVCLLRPQFPWEPEQLF